MRIIRIVRPSWFSRCVVASLVVLCSCLGDVGPLAVGAGPAPLSVVWSNQPAGSPFATVDALGNVLTAESGSGTPIFVRKYDSGGNSIWSNMISDTNAVLAVATDPSGNLLVASSLELTRVSSDGNTTSLITIPTSPILTMVDDPSRNVILAENNWSSNLTLEKFSPGGVLLNSMTFSSIGCF